MSLHVRSALSPMGLRDADAVAHDDDGAHDEDNDAAPSKPEGAARGACGKVASEPRRRKVRQGACSTNDKVRQCWYSG